MKLNRLEIYPKTSFHNLMSFPPSFLGIMRFPDAREKKKKTMFHATELCLSFLVATI